MVSVQHEVIVELFRERPALVRGPLSSVRIKVEDLRPVDPTLNETTPKEHRADLVLLGSDAVVVVEPQLAVDRRKLYSWPHYVAALWARHRLPVWLVVATPSRSVARWAKRSIHAGSMTVTPFVIGPAGSGDDDSPEAALLALFLTDEAHLRARADAAMSAVHQIDETRRDRYIHLVVQWLRARDPSLLEALMTDRKFVWPRDPWLDEHDRAVRAEAEARGEARGLALGLAKAVLLILDAAHVPVTSEQQDRILAMSDDATLARWLRLAHTITRVEQLFEA